MKPNQEIEFSNALEQNIDLIHYFMGKSSDVIVRELLLPCKLRCVLFYLDGMVDKQALQDNVVTPLLERSPENNVSIHSLEERFINVSEVAKVQSIETALDQMISGGVLFLMDKANYGLIIPLPGWEDRGITESQTQTTVRGPQNSFTETLRTNTTQVRRIVKDTRVRISTVKVGKLTKTDIAIMYIKGLADEDLIKQLHERLQSISVDRILEGEYLEELLSKNKQWTLFPTSFNSDRPDSIAAGILEGKIALFVDGTPFVLLVPSFFTDFIQSADDYYQPYIYSSAIRILRYISLFICMLAPSVYIALTTYHQDMLPTQLLLSLAAQREGVPFPAFVEALIMEIAFEILREAGLRMPRTIGQAVSIVGTIVIGQAAVEAGIVSAVMVIVVAITAISSFVLPAYTMSLTTRLIRFGFMGFAAMFGAYGLTIGILILVVHLCSLQSYGFPYMSPIAPYLQGEQSDAILRFPYRNLRKKESRS